MKANSSGSAVEGFDFVIKTFFVIINKTEQEMKKV